MICSIALALLRVGERRRVGDDLGVAGQDRVDHLQPGGPQRTAGLGDLDDAVGDVGDLRLGRPVRQAHVGVDAMIGEEPLGELGVLGLDAHAVREVLDRVAGLSPATATTSLIGLLVALEYFSSPRLSTTLPVSSTQSRPVIPTSKRPFGDVRRDLLGPQDPDRLDAGIVDRRLVVDRRRPVHRKVGLLEQIECRLLERTLREDQSQHDRPRLPALAPPSPDVCVGVSATRSTAGSRDANVVGWASGQWEVSVSARRRRACGSTSMTASSCSTQPFVLPGC